MKLSTIKVLDEVLAICRKLIFEAPVGDHVNQAEQQIHALREKYRGKPDEHYILLEKGRGVMISSIKVFDTWDSLKNNIANAERTNWWGWYAYRVSHGDCILLTINDLRKIGIR